MRKLNPVNNWKSRTKVDKSHHYLTDSHCSSKKNLQLPGFELEVSLLEVYSVARSYKQGHISHRVPNLEKERTEKENTPDKQTACWTSQDMICDLHWYQKKYSSIKCMTSINFLPPIGQRCPFQTLWLVYLQIHQAQANSKNLFSTRCIPFSMSKSLHDDQDSSKTNEKTLETKIVERQKDSVQSKNLASSE